MPIISADVTEPQVSQQNNTIVWKFPNKLGSSGHFERTQSAIRKSASRRRRVLGTNEWSDGGTIEGVKSLKWTMILGGII